MRRGWGCMVEPRLFLDGSANAVVGVVFLLVGRRFLQHPATGEAGQAVRAFAVWWFLYGIQSLLASTRILRVAAGDSSVAAFEWTFQVETSLAVLALWGTIMYQSYLWWGNMPRGWVIALGLLTMAGVFGWIVYRHDAVAVVVEGWRTDLEFHRPMAPRVRWGMVGGYYGLMMAVAASFLALAAHVRDHSPRLRAAALGCLLILLAAMDALILGPQTGSPLVPVWTTLKALAAVGVAMIYFPPRWLQSRAGLVPV